MSFIRLMCKAAQLDKRKNELEEDKKHTFKLSKGANAKKSLRQKYKHSCLDCKRKVKRCLRKLFTFPEKSCIFRCCYKLRHDGTCENYTWKSIVGFIGGFIITYVFFMFFVFQLNFKFSTATIMCSIFGSILTIGLAFSYKVRCIVFLTLPQLFSKRGRQALLAYAFILAITGPAKNTLNNMGILSESLACGQEQLKSAVKQILEVIKKPFYAIRDAIRTVVKVVKMIVKKIKEILLAIKRIILALIKVIKSVFQFLAKIVNICNKEIGTPFQRCTRVFENAISDCHAKLGPMFSWLCSISYIVQSVCYIVKLLDFVCMVVDFISNSVIGVVIKKVKTFVRHIKTMFYVRIKFSHSFHFETNASKSLDDVATGIVTEIKERTEGLMKLFDFMSCATSLFFMFIIFRVIYYRYKFLTNERFDNRFITKDFRAIDIRRAQLGKETVLPLNHRERNIYISVGSLRLVKKEKLKLSQSAVVLGMASLKLATHMMADYVLFWVLILIRTHASFQSTFEGSNIPTLHVKGEGLLADLLRSIVKAFQPIGVRLEIDTVPCLPDPIPPDYDRYVQIVSLLVICWLLMIFEPFGLRWRHSVMCFYHPLRAKQRAIWLYNNILRRRSSFLKFARRQLRRKIKGDSGITKITFKEFLQAHLRWPIFRLCLGPDKQDACLLCGEIFRETDAVKPIRCATPNCPGIYCEKCFQDLQNKCTVCLDPIHYGDLSDISEEKDSSDVESRTSKLVKKKKDKKTGIESIFKHRARRGTFDDTDSEGDTRRKKKKKDRLTWGPTTSDSTSTTTDTDAKKKKKKKKTVCRPKKQKRTTDDDDTDSDTRQLLGSGDSSSSTRTRSDSDYYSSELDYTYQYQKDITRKAVQHPQRKFVDVEKQRIPDYASMETFREGPSDTDATAKATLGSDKGVAPKKRRSGARGRKSASSGSSTDTSRVPYTPTPSSTDIESAAEPKYQLPSTDSSPAGSKTQLIAEKPEKPKKASASKKKPKPKKAHEDVPLLELSSSNEQSGEQNEMPSRSPDTGTKFMESPKEAFVEPKPKAKRRWLWFSKPKPKPAKKAYVGTSTSSDWSDEEIRTRPKAATETTFIETPKETIKPKPKPRKVKAKPPPQGSIKQREDIKLQGIIKPAPEPGTEKEYQQPSPTTETTFIETPKVTQDKEKPPTKKTAKLKKKKAASPITETSFIDTPKSPAVEPKKSPTKEDTKPKLKKPAPPKRKESTVTISTGTSEGSSSHTTIPDTPPERKVPITPIKPARPQVDTWAKTEKLVPYLDTLEGDRGARKTRGKVPEVPKDVPRLNLNFDSCECIQSSCNRRPCQCEKFDVRYHIESETSRSGRGSVRSLTFTPDSSRSSMMRSRFSPVKNNSSNTPSGDTYTSSSGVSTTPTTKSTHDTINYLYNVPKYEQFADYTAPKVSTGVDKPGLSKKCQRLDKRSFDTLSNTTESDAYAKSYKKKVRNYYKKMKTEQFDNPKVSRDHQSTFTKFMNKLLRKENFESTPSRPRLTKSFLSESKQPTPKSLVRYKRKPPVAQSPKTPAAKSKSPPNTSGPRLSNFFYNFLMGAGIAPQQERKNFKPGVIQTTSTSDTVFVNYNLDKFGFYDSTDSEISELRQPIRDSSTRSQLKNSSTERSILSRRPFSLNNKSRVNGSGSTIDSAEEAFERETPAKSIRINEEREEQTIEEDDENYAEDEEESELDDEDEEEEEEEEDEEDKLGQEVEEEEEEEEEEEDDEEERRLEEERQREEERQSEEEERQREEERKREEERRLEEERRREEERKREELRRREEERKREEERDREEEKLREKLRKYEEELEKRRQQIERYNRALEEPTRDKDSEQAQMSIEKRRSSLDRPIPSRYLREPPERDQNYEDPRMKKNCSQTSEIRQYFENQGGKPPCCQCKNPFDCRHRRSPQESYDYNQCPQYRRYNQTGPSCPERKRTTYDLAKSAENLRQVESSNYEQNRNPCGYPSKSKQQSQSHSSPEVSKNKTSMKSEDMCNSEGTDYQYNDYMSAKNECYNGNQMVRMKSRCASKYPYEESEYNNESHDRSCVCDHCNRRNQYQNCKCYNCMRSGDDQFSSYSDDDAQCANGMNLAYQRNEEYPELVGEIENTISQRNKDRVRKTMRQFEILSRQNKGLDKPIYDDDDDENGSRYHYHKRNCPTYNRPKSRDGVSCCNAMKQRQCYYDRCQNYQSRSECLSERPAYSATPFPRNRGYVEKVARYMDPTLSDNAQKYPKFPAECTNSRWQMDPRSGEWVKVFDENYDFENSYPPLPAPPPPMYGEYDNYAKSQPCQNYYNQSQSMRQSSQMKRSMTPTKSCNCRSCLQPTTRYQQ